MEAKMRADKEPSAVVELVEQPQSLQSSSSTKQQPALKRPMPVQVNLEPQVQNPNLSITIK
jgi:hypothetical protein